MTLGFLEGMKSLQMSQILAVQHFPARSKSGSGSKSQSKSQSNFSRNVSISIAIAIAIAIAIWTITARRSEARLVRY
jgi:hypothetical protein